MRISVERFTSNDRATVGILSVDGVFNCFTLEDPYRETKMQDETRIPEGTYRVGVRNFGGFNNRYTEKFGVFHRGMLEILDVDGFTDILIHVGNYAKDTSGCLLVGQGAVCSPNDPLKITASVKAYKILYEKVIDAAAADDLDIFIIDRDGKIGD